MFSKIPHAKPGLKRIVGARCRKQNCQCFAKQPTGNKLEQSPSDVGVQCPKFTRPQEVTLSLPHVPIAKTSNNADNTRGKKGI